jgi:hypothetical protein
MNLRIGGGPAFLILALEALCPLFRMHETVNPNLLFEWDHLVIPSAPRRLKPWRTFFQPAPEADQDSQRI